MGSGGSVTRRALLVGAGAMGRNWAKNLSAHGAVDLVAWVDVNAVALEEAVANLDRPTLVCETDLERALALVHPDFVVDVSPPAAHHDVTVMALQAGVPVLGEKPMADTLERARAMVKAAERAGRLYMVSQSRRYNPGLAALRRLIQTVIGPPALLSARFFMGARERGHRLVIDQPLLTDMAIHHFDMARYLTGADPLSVSGETWNPPWSWYRGDACANLTFELTGGLRFTYTGSWCSEGVHTSWDGDWRAGGPHGSARWAGGQAVPVAEVVTERGGFLPTTVEQPGLVEPAPAGIAGSLNDFLTALETGVTPPGECHDNIRSLAMVFGAIEAAATGRRVTIDAERRAPPP